VKFLLYFIVSLSISSCYEVVKDTRILEYESPYIGKTFRSPQLMAYYEGFKGSDCRNNICTLKSDYLLNKFANRYISNDKYFLIPKGTPLKVVASFTTEDNSFLYRIFNSRIKHVIIELPNGKTAEVSELSFKLDVAKGRDGDFASFLPEIEDFKKNNFSNSWYCLNIKNGDKYLYFEDKVNRTINYYGLSPYIKIVGVARSKNSNEETSCIKLEGKDLQAFLILKHRLHYVKAPVKQYLLKNNNLCDAKNSQSCLKRVEFLEISSSNI